MLGYTLSPSAQHRGFALDAAAAMVDMLFERTDTRRIVASVDDANVASMRVIETLGFRYEGIARQASLVRGEWLDEDPVRVVRDDRAAWLSRPRPSPERVELVELVHDNVQPYAELTTHRYQQQFVAPMAESFRHALLPEMVDGARCGAVVPRCCCRRCPSRVRDARGGDGELP